MSNKFNNRLIFISLMLLIGVSCGDLRGPAVILPIENLDEVPSDSRGDDTEVEVTDPSNASDPDEPSTQEPGSSDVTTGESFEVGNECGVESVTTEAVFAPVDIFWVVDTSGSMNREIELIEERLGDFANFISETGLDYRIVVIGAAHEDRPGSYDICVPPPLSSVDTCPDEDGERYRHIRRHVGSYEPFIEMVDAFDEYGDFIRPNAVAHIVNVTDDNSEMRAEFFLEELGATGHVPFIDGPIVHAIASDVGETCFLGICWDSACDGPYGAAAEIGREYLEITALTGGVFRDICTADWDPVFGAIAETVIASTQVPCAFQFPETPNGYDVDLNYVEVQFEGISGAEQVPRVDDAQACGANGGWYVDILASPSTLYLCPESCGNVVGTLEIVFGCGKA